AGSNSSARYRSIRSQIRRRPHPHPGRRSRLSSPLRNNPEIPRVDRVRAPRQDSPSPLRKVHDGVVRTRTGRELNANSHALFRNPHFSVPPSFTGKGVRGLGSEPPKITKIPPTNAMRKFRPTTEAVWTTESRGHPLPQKFRGELFTLTPPHSACYPYNMTTVT